MGVFLPNWRTWRIRNEMAAEVGGAKADKDVDGVEGSLLVLVLDVNPDQRLFFGKSFSRMSQWLDSAVAFVNAHLLLHPNNEVCVVAVSKNTCQFLHPEVNPAASGSSRPTGLSNRTKDGQFEGFRDVEATIRSNALALLKREMAHQSLILDSLVAGGLCMALSYINRRQKESDLATASDDGKGQKAAASSDKMAIKARVLVMTASGATASQYMNYMNAFFTAQKMGVPVDTCMMDRESGLLQQGADITGGLYVKVPNLDCLFQFLSWIFLPDTGKDGLRSQLGMPTSAKVDYRAACFCHRNLVDVGFVCSVCLSIFCKISPICTTCQTVFKTPAPILPAMNLSLLLERGVV